MSDVNPYQYSETSNDTNPYAAPSLIEEDAPGYDLRKIARLYNRLSIWMGRLLDLVFIDITLLALLGLSVFETINTGKTPKILIWGMIGLVIPLHFVTGMLFIYCAYLVEHIARAMKYRWYATYVIVCCALIFPVNFFIVNLMCRNAEAILRDGGIEIINGKVDLVKIPIASIPLKNDY